ncbi:MAG: glycosyltransferase family 9 protein [Alphaproteobacteria bacterium]
MAQDTNRSINSIGVLVGLDLIGDALIKLPFIRALRTAFPQAEISWITTQGKSFFSGPLRELSRPYLDHVLEQPEFLAEPDKAAPRYDILIDTRNRWRMAREARRIPHEVFIAPAMRYLFSDRRPLMFWHKQPHIRDRLLELVRLAAGRMPEVAGGIPVPESYRAKAAAALPEGPVYAGLVPGAGNKVKIWPRERFVELAARQQAAGRVPAFLIGPQETEWLAELQAAVPSAKFPLQDPVWGGAYDLAATMAVGERLACAVTGDNGTSHMLAAVDCPLVSLFGPTNAAKLAPRVSHGKVIIAQQFGGEAMALIPLDAVARAADELCGGIGAAIVAAKRAAS